MSGAQDNLATTPQGGAVSRLRVTKKLAITNRGAIKLHRKFGDALVCVRHRISDDGRLRYTTVEILVDLSPIQRRHVQTVHVRIGLAESDLRKAVAAAGGVWDPQCGLWKIPKRIVHALDLQRRVVGIQAK